MVQQKFDFSGLKQKKKNLSVTLTKMQQKKRNREKKTGEWLETL